jgi:hypothetical protein
MALLCQHGVNALGRQPSVAGQQALAIKNLLSAIDEADGMARGADLLKTYAAVQQTSPDGVEPRCCNLL